MLKKNKKIVTFGLLFLLLVIYFLLHKYINFKIPCMFHFVTGFYCPGCGLTRMIFSIFKLDFYQAFRYNPLVFILGIIYLIYKLIEIVLNKKIKIPEYVYYILIVILILYGILRNIDIFSYLAPTKL